MGRYRMYQGPDGMKDMRKRVSDSLLCAAGYGFEFNAVLVHGMSGVIPGAIAAAELNLYFLLLRKPGESSHGSTYEGDNWYGHDTRPVIIDDFISSGQTLCHIVTEYKRLRGTHINEIVGVVLYGQPVTEREKEDGGVQTHRMREADFHLKRQFDYFFTIHQGELE